MTIVLFALSFLTATTAPTEDQAPLALDRFIEGSLHVSRYRWASVDLDGDGKPEALVYATAPDDCGSGGCALYVLTAKDASYRVVTELSVTQAPIRVLSSTTRGWRDLAVRVVGGGILPGYDTKLRFDGNSYPTNPTVPPARRINHPGGTVVIGP